MQAANDMALWQQMLVGVAALLLVLWMRPGLQAAMAQSRAAERKDWKSVLIPILLVILFVLMLISMVRRPAAAATFALPPAGNDVIGELTTAEVRDGETLIDIAREHGLGYNEIVAANPGLDPWLPPAGAKVVLPNRHVLPNTPRSGIIVNLSEMRLYYYPPPSSDGAAVVMTFPIGIGQEGWVTPLGITRVVSKIANPAWTVPESIRAEHAKAGDPLPKVVPAGPDNPLGAYAMRLGWNNFLIHGTNKPFGVGMRVSHGCIRLYPEDIKELFEHVAVQTPVWIIDQPFKLGRDDGKLLLEMHAPVSDPGVPKADDSSQILAAIEAITPSSEWAKARRAAMEAIERKSGVPELIADLKRDSDGQLSSHGTGIDGWMLQVGAFTNRDNAVRLARDLAGLGAGRMVSVKSWNGDGYCRVLIGPYPDADAARAARTKVEHATGYRGTITSPDHRAALKECVL
jgi:L,D-transpeptidase ErfK/SrfK